MNIITKMLDDIKDSYKESKDALLYRLIKERLSLIINSYYSDICSSIDYYDNRLSEKAIKILEKLSR